MRPLSAVAAAAAIVSLSLSSGACANLHARAAGPALETPVPPPRVIPQAALPIESQPIVASPPVGEVQPTTPPALNPPDSAPQSPPTTPPPAAPPVAAERPSTPPSQEPPPPTLQTTANPEAGEERTLLALDKAKRDLGRIDMKTLSTDGKAQYDMARRFVAQATDALTAKNYDFAQQLADKAATLAAGLLRR